MKTGRAMDYLGEFWWVPIIAAALGAFLGPLIGYFRQPRNGTARSTIHSAAVVDSSVGREIAIELRRIAKATEGIRSHLEQTAKDEKASDIADLRAEVRRLKNEKDE